jgi:hypothetical protein
MVARLNDERKMRDVIEDCKALTKNIQLDIRAEIDQTNKRTSDIAQHIGVHEEKLIRIIDDRNVFEISKN